MEEKKVYEGYKRTSTRKSTAEKSATETLTAPKKTTTPKEPRKRTTARMAGRSSIAKPRLAMFIDVDNAGVSRENLLEILFYANGKFKIELCKLYGFSEETLPGIRDFASEYNVTTIGKMQFKQPGVNSLDSRLLVDAYECALNNKNKIDMIFVWCYPCDLENLFEKISNLGISTATIDNSIFDCKNKFVTQTFKLYSPYHFSVEQSTFGSIKNEPAPVTADENIEANETKPTPVATVPETTTSASTVEEPAPKPAEQPGTIDGVVPPVLPRRQILERSNPNQPRPQIQPEAEPENAPVVEESTRPTSLVEEIARKLNLEIPDDEDFEEEQKAAAEATSNMFLDMLKQAGFEDNRRPLKYEDTIGDL